MASISKELNNIIYVEPNYTYSSEEYDTNGLNTYPFIPPTEDYCIYVNLSVEVKKRKVNVSNESTEKIVLSWDSTPEKSTVKLMQGTEMPGGVRYFTTDYTDTFLGDIKSKGPTTEMFGISSIDISYNKYMQPEVTINFVDVRGVSVFAQRAYYEAAINDTKTDHSLDGGEQNITNTFFQCFFTMPFPVFTLTVKGLYGKAVSYQLLCTDFKANFQSKNGSFACTAKFVGSHFAFLGDTMMNAILSSPYSDYIGRDYWKMRGFKIPSYNGGNTECPTVPELFHKLKRVQADRDRISQSSVEAQELTAAQAKSDDVNTLKNAYKLYMDSVLSIVKENAKNSFSSFGIDIEPWMQELYEDDKDLIKRFSVIFAVEKRTNILGSTIDKPEYDNLGGVAGITERIILTGEMAVKNDYSNIQGYRENLSSVVNTYDKDLVFNANDILSKKYVTCFSTANAILLAYYFSLPNDYKLLIEKLKGVQDKLQENEGKYSYVLFTYSSDIEKLIHNKESNDNTVDLEEAKKAMEDKVNEITNETLGFVPSVENLTYIMMAHFETFAYMLYQCGKDITNEKRTVDSLGITKDDVSDVDIAKTDEIVPPFPRVTKIVEKDGQRNREETWVGDYSGYFLEKEFVNGVLNGIQEVNRLVNIVVDDEVVGIQTNSPTFSLVKIPLTLYDIVTENDIYGEIDFNDMSSFLSLIAVRAFDIMYLDNNGDIKPSAENMGAAEAENLMAKMTVPSDVIDKLNGLSGNTDAIISMLKGEESDFIKKPNEGQGPWPWRIDQSNNDGIISDNRFNICYDAFLRIIYTIPVTNLSWKNINDCTINGGGLSHCEKAYNSMDFIDSNAYADRIKDASTIKNNLFTVELNMNRVSDIISKQIGSYKDLVSYSEGLLKQAKYDKEKYKDNYIDDGNAEDIIVFIIMDAKKLTPGEDKCILPVSPSLITDKKIKYFGGGFNGNDAIDAEIDEWHAERKFEEGEGEYYEHLNSNDLLLVEFPYIDEDGDADTDLSCFGNTFYYNQTSIYAKAFVYLCGFEYFIEYNKVCEDLADASKQILNIPLPSVIYAGALIYFNEQEKGFNDWQYTKSEKVSTKFVLKHTLRYTNYLKNLHPEVKKNLSTMFIQWVNGNAEWDASGYIKPFKSYCESLELKPKYSYENGIITFLDSIGEIEDDEDWIDEGIFEGKGYDENLMNLLCGELDDNFFANYITIDKDHNDGGNGGMRLINRDGGRAVVTACKFALAGCTFVKHTRFFNEVGNISISEDNFRNFFDGFISKLCQNTKNEAANTSVSITSEPSSTNDDIKLGVYRYAKLLYDKWIGGLTDNDFNEEYTVESFFEGPDRYFVFIDTYYNKANDKIMNLGHFVESIRECFGKNQYSLLSFLSEEYAYNKFSFNCISNFLDINNRENIKSLFNVVPLSLMGDPKKHPNFVVMLCDEPSSHLNLKDDGFPDDSFDISRIDDMSNWPEPLKSRNEGAVEGYLIPAFGVTYGQMYQSYFQDIEVGMDNPMMTEQAIKTQWQIVSAENVESSSGERANNVYYGQDLYSVFSNYSYSCNVSMLGCAFIQPLMYFCLNNIPMFRGTYLIQKVEHSITPGNMITKFTGIRMSNVSTRRVKEYMVSVDCASGGNGADGVSMENKLANIDNDCNYKVYPLMTGGGNYGETSFANVLAGLCKDAPGYSNKSNGCMVGSNWDNRNALDSLAALVYAESDRTEGGILLLLGSLYNRCRFGNNNFQYVFNTVQYSAWKNGTAENAFNTKPSGYELCKQFTSDVFSKGICSVLVGKTFTMPTGWDLNRNGNNKRNLSNGQTFTVDLDFASTMYYYGFKAEWDNTFNKRDNFIRHKDCTLLGIMGSATPQAICSIEDGNREKLLIKDNVGVANSEMSKTDLSVGFINALNKTIATSSIGISVGIDGSKSKDNKAWIVSASPNENFGNVLDVILRAYGNYVESVDIVLTSETTNSTPNAFICGLKEGSSATNIKFVKSDGTTPYCGNQAIGNIGELPNYFTASIYKNFRSDKNAAKNSVTQLSESAIDAIFARHSDGEYKIKPCAELLTSSGSIGGGDGTAALENVIVFGSETCVNKRNVPPSYIVIHYTAGSTSSPGTAKSVCQNWVNTKLRGGQTGSADFVVDDDSIYQFAKDVTSYSTWNCGDSIKRNGPRFPKGGAYKQQVSNQNSIGIELCSSLKSDFKKYWRIPNQDGWYFTNAVLTRGIELVRGLMKKYNIPKEHVVRHYDVTGKQCPGIRGWNTEYMNSLAVYPEKSHPITTDQNNESAWMNFWNSI